MLKRRREKMVKNNNRIYGALLCLVLCAGCATGRGTGRGTVIMPKPVQGQEGLYHKVKKGETLWSICRLYGADVREVTAMNRLPDASKIEENQMLFIPGAGRSSPAERREGAAAGGFMWPVRGKIVSAFGGQAGNGVNKGMEIAVPEGTRVVAARDGIVVFAEEKFKGFGKVVILEHDGGFQTVYAYNSENLVKAGDRVSAGTAIAKAGRTGRAAVPSLHFEIRKNQVPQNPLDYLPQ